MNELFRDDDVMFHLVGFSKVLIRVFFSFFFGNFVVSKGWQNFSIFSQFVFQIYITRTKISKCFCCNSAKICPKKLPVLTTDTWAMMGCDMLPCPHCHSLSLRWNNNLIANFVL
jgi:hypothetical protein